MGHHPFSRCSLPGKSLPFHIGRRRHENSTVGSCCALAATTHSHSLGIFIHVGFMKIAIAADHGGFELKEELKRRLETFSLTDLGTHSADSVDYPDFGASLAKRVASKEFDFGILLCGTGIGISIAANKVKGIRAALCHNTYTAEMARKHNDANILAMGGRVVDTELATQITQTFLKTAFEGGRHARRVDKITALE